MKNLFALKAILPAVMAFTCTAAFAGDVNPSATKMIIIKGTVCTRILHIADAGNAIQPVKRISIFTPRMIRYSKPAGQQIDLAQLDREMDRSQENMSRMDHDLQAADAADRSKATAILKTGIQSL